MAELTEDDLITKVNAIDAQILLITTAIDNDDGAHLVDHSIGNKTVHGSQKLEQLIKAREIYQMLLESNASEQSSRMVAMKNASDASGDMIDDLTPEELSDIMIPWLNATEDDAIPPENGTDSATT